MPESKKEWTYDFEELCICGHPGVDHCLDDHCCIWDINDHEYGGACSCGCDCPTYRPRSMHPDEVEDENG